MHWKGPIISVVLIIVNDLAYTEIMEGREGVSELLQDIVLKKFPSCDTILVYDEYFQHFSLVWIGHTLLPIFSVNLAVPSTNVGKPLGNFLVDSFGRGQTTCSTILVCCRAKSSCRTRNSERLWQMLSNHGILRRDRRSFLFIQNETTATLKFPSFYQEENTEHYNVPILKDAVGILKKLKSHITIIRRLVNLEEKANASPTFQLLTFTPNWLPGGTPVLRDVWSLKRGFLNPNSDLQIKLKHIRPGGTARFALPNGHLLPAIDIGLNGEVSGLEGEVIGLVAEKFKLNLQFEVVSDHNFGEREPDGTWTGVIKQLIEKKSDFGVGQLLFAENDQESGLQFGPATTILQGVVVCKLPKFLPKWRLLYAPFQTWVWVAVSTTLCCILLYVEILQRRLNKIFKPRKRWGEGWFPRKKKPVTWFAWIYSITPMLMQSTLVTLLPQRNAFRCLFAFWFVVGFWMSYIYGSILISKFSVPPKETPIQSITDLIQRGKNWAVSGLIEAILDDTLGKTERLLLHGSTYIEGSGLADDQQEYKYVMETDNCAVIEKTRAQYIIFSNYSIAKNHKLYPLMTWSKESFFLGPSGWIMRSDMDFILMSYFDDIFLRYQGHGLLQNAASLYSGNYDLRQLMKEDDNAKLQMLGLDALQGVFYVFLICVGISFLAFVLELCCFSLNGISRRKSFATHLRLLKAK